jgi:hypothetical protein
MRIAHQSSYLPEKAARKLVRETAYDAGSEVWALNGDAETEA